MVAVTLRAERVKFTAKLVDLLAWIRATHPGWEIALDEGTVHSPRTCWTVNGKVSLRDGVHRTGSRHHEGCAMDLLLYIPGDPDPDDYIDNGNHPAWLAIGKKAESLGLAWGGRFGDANHVSLAASDGRK